MRRLSWTCFAVLLACNGDEGSPDAGPDDASVADAAPSDAAPPDADVPDAAPQGCPDPGTGNGTRFAAALVAARPLGPEGDAPVFYDVTDWDGDGWPDVVAFTATDPIDHAYVYAGATCFTEVVSVPVDYARGGAQLIEALVDDFDADGRPDLFVFQIHQLGEVPDTLKMTVYSGAGATPFQAVLFDRDVRPFWDVSIKLTTADHDDDGKPDLLITVDEPGIETVTLEVIAAADAYSSVSAWFPTPLISSSLAGNHPPRAYVAHDWDDDGIAELCAMGVTPEAEGQVVALAGAGGYAQELFTQPMPDFDPSSFLQDYALADWDDDGVDDLFILHKRNPDVRTVEIRSGD